MQRQIAGPSGARLLWTVSGASEHAGLLSKRGAPGLHRARADPRALVARIPDSKTRVSRRGPGNCPARRSGFCLRSVRGRILRSAIARSSALLLLLLACLSGALLQFPDLLMEVRSWHGICSRWEWKRSPDQVAGTGRDTLAATWIAELCEAGQRLLRRQEDAALPM